MLYARSFQIPYSDKYHWQYLNTFAPCNNRCKYVKAVRFMVKRKYKSIKTFLYRPMIQNKYIDRNESPHARKSQLGKPHSRCQVHRQSWLHQPISQCSQLSAAEKRTGFQYHYPPKQGKSKASHIIWYWDCAAWLGSWATFSKKSHSHYKRHLELKLGVASWKITVVKTQSNIFMTIFIYYYYYYYLTATELNVNRTWHSQRIVAKHHEVIFFDISSKGAEGKGWS